MNNIDKKSIINDLYQAAVRSVFVVGYSILGKDTEDDTSKHSEVLSGRHGKAGAIVVASEMTREYRISSNRRSYQNTSTSKCSSQNGEC